MIPFPFSISLIFLSLAFLTSKLQYHSTYLTIAVYSVLGPIQTGAIAFSVFTFLNHRIDQTIMILFFTSLFIIFLLNLIAYIIQSCYLLEDRKFRKWANRRASEDDYKTNYIWFQIICFLAFVSSYKLKMVFFSRLFNFQCFKFQLTSLDKFKAFNILSFLGYFPEILSLYCCFMGLLYIKFSQEEVFAFIDCLIIIIMNMIFSIAIIYKESDFFREEVDGLPMNQVVNIIQEMNSATAILEQKERSNKQRVGNRALEDISEYEEFAYNSTKRQRNIKFTGNAQKSQKEESCFFQDNSEVNTGSRIHSQASQNQQNEAVVANCVEEEVIIKQAFKNILEVDQNYDEESSEQMSTKEKQNVVSQMICSDQPLSFPNQEISLVQKMKQQLQEQEKAQAIAKQTKGETNERLNSLNNDQANKRKDSAREKIDEGRIQMIDQIIPSDQQSSKKQQNFKMLINESALIESQQSARIQQQTFYNYSKLQKDLEQIAKMAKMTVKRVVSAHHSPNRRIKKEGDILNKTEISNISMMHINEDHDQKPIKNKSAEKLKKYVNNPLSSGTVTHPLYGKMHHTQQKREQHNEKREENFEERRQHIFRKRGKVETRTNRIMETEAQSNFPNNIFEEKEENTKQFKRSKPNNFSLAQFSTKNNTIDNVIIEKELIQGNVMRKPTERIQLKFDEMSQSPSQVLSRQERHRFADKRERPFTSNNLNRKIKSLERKSSSVVGKRKTSLEKIYLQKLIIF